MKKIFFILILITAISASFAQNKNDTIFIVFEKNTHDFGTIVKGANGEYDFKFTNKGGDTPLTLTNVSSSCGCTVPTYPKEPIKPGKTGSIKVKYDTNRIGTFTKTITVNSNAKNSSVILTIKGNVIDKTN